MTRRDLRRLIGTLPGTLLRPMHLSPAAAARCSLICLGMCLLISVFVVGLAATGAWRADYREQLMDELRAKVPWIDDVIWDINGNWVPWPWQADPRNAEQIIASLDRANDAHQDGLGVPWGNGRLARQQFISYLIGWSNEQRLCENVAIQFPALASKICGDRSTRLAPAWREFFVDELYGSHFANVVDGRPVFGERLARSARTCNISPVDIDVARVELLASESAEMFYREALGVAIPGLHQVGWERVAVGDCREHSLQGFDVPPEMLVHMRPEDAQFEAWFSTIWTQYYAPELASPGGAASLLAQQQSAVRGEFCTPQRGFDRAVDSSQNSCGVAEPALPYVEGFDAADAPLFFAATLPYTSILDDTQTAIDEERLSTALQEAIAWKQLAVRYKGVQEKWAAREPRYVVGAALADANGPFHQGLAAAAIPQRTILFEDIVIPSSGTIIAINGRPVYAIEDVHELLDLHGSSRSAGIDEFLKVQMPDDTGGIMEYSTRFRFNPGVAQEFDTNVGFTQGFVEGLSFNSEGLACRVKRVFVEIGQAECTWIDSQRNAYARQVSPEAFRTGEVASFFVPWGPAAVKVLTRGRRMSGWSQVLLAGGIEAGLAGSYEIIAAPPAMPLEQRMEHARTGVVFGFVFGAAFYK